MRRTLSWDEQVNAITTKVNRGLNVLKRLREFLDIETFTNCLQNISATIL